MRTLSLSTVKSASLLIPGADPWHAHPGDPALSVMTDFRERTSVTVATTAPIDAALEHMKHTGVRCAFAVDESQQRVVGLITAYDILSEKPMHVMQSTGNPRQEVLVQDLMQRIVEWRVLEVKDVEQATVAQVSRMFEGTRLTHIPVMETTPQGERRLRGLFSAVRLKRLLAT